MNEQPGRVFTRAAVEQFFEHTFGRFQNPTYTLVNVSVLPEIAQGAWDLEYTITYRDWPEGPAVRYRHLVLLHVTRADGTSRLHLPDGDELPVGCSTPQEEDVTIQARKEARGREEQP